MGSEDRTIEGEETTSSSFDRGAPGDGIYAHFDNAPVPIIRDAEDGLPRPAAQPSLHAPPLSIETLTCMGDERSFVRRDLKWGTVIREFSPDEVEQMPSGLWRHKADQMEVEPIRRPCAFYARQLFDFRGDDKTLSCERLCTARRDSQGEFLSLQDSQMVACELRQPPDLVALEYLRRYDRLKLKQGEVRRKQGDGANLDAIGVDADADLDGVID